MTRLLAIAMLGAIAATPVAAQLNVTRRADLGKPVALAPGQAAIIVGFRRPDNLSAGKSGILVFARYDLENRDLIDRPRGAKKSGDTNTYSISVRSGDRKLPLDHAVMLVSPGDYVLLGAAAGPLPSVTNNFCFSAPVFHVGAGETVYFGDVTPYLGVELAEPNIFKPPSVMGIKVIGDNIGNAMAYSSHPDDARAAVAGQPTLAAGFKPGAIRNGATFGCNAPEMTAYIVPGAESLPETETQRAAMRNRHPDRKAPTPAPILVPSR